MDRLRTETRGAHELTEAIPFSSAMVEQRLPRDRFVGQLGAYLLVHRALERALAASTAPVVVKVWGDDLRKTPLLERDLAFHARHGHDAARGGEPSAKALAAAQRFAAAIDELAPKDPAALLGMLYVLEGSTLGAAVLRGHLAKTYGLDDPALREAAGAPGDLPGLAYYAPYGPSPMPHWKQFKERMNAAIVDPAQQERAIAGADEAFRRIGEILRELSVGIDRSRTAEASPGAPSAPREHSAGRPA